MARNGFGTVPRPGSDLEIERDHGIVHVADVLIKHGRNAELKTLARKMKAAKQAEIKLMAPHTK